MHNTERSPFWFDFLYRVLLYTNGLGVNLEAHHSYER